MRSNPEKDEWLRARLREAVERLAGGSADKFGQAIGYANGGYVREILNGKKPVRDKIVERIVALPGYERWFDAEGLGFSSEPAQQSRPSNTGPVVHWSLSPDEAAVIEAYRAQKAAAQRLKELTAIDADQATSTPVFPLAADTNVAPLPVRESGGPGGLRLTAAQKVRQRGAPAKKTSHE